MNTGLIVIFIILEMLPAGIGGRYKEELIKRNTFSRKPAEAVTQFSPLPNYEKFSFEYPLGGYITVDLNTGQRIGGKNENTRMQIASLTKLMTAYVLLNERNMKDTVTVRNLSRVGAEDAKIYLSVGERLTFQHLLEATLISSASDAAITIAEHDAGGYDKFIKKMNAYAKQLGMKNTKFDNPVGWDSKNNFSTAFDLQILTRKLLQNEAFRKVVSTKKTTFKTNKRTYTLYNTNALLDNKRVFGVKTGTTDQARQCLITLSENNGYRAVTVFIGSKDRYMQAETLFGRLKLVYNW